MACKPYFIHAVTPVHLGAGRGLGYIDLPVVREKGTNWPYIPGSSLKGVITDLHKAAPGSRTGEALAAFGGENADNADKFNVAGSLVFTDAHLLCLPVRSFFGSFAWITSPFCLKRCFRDMNGTAPAIPAPDAGQICVCSQSSLKSGGKVYLEDLDIDVATDNADAAANAIADAVFAGDDAWKGIFKKRFAVVDDDTFTFLCEMGTEVTPHIAIDDNTGIVDKEHGALWYEETLPVETILCGAVWCDKAFSKGLTDADGNTLEISPESLLNKFCTNDDHLQLGGKASTGKGIVRLVYA